MILLPSRSVLAIAAVVDVALHARGAPVTAKCLAARHGLKPRHLETVLQALVRGGILKGLRGSRGGYALARERRRVTAADILRAAGRDREDGHARSGLVRDVVEPAIREAGLAFLDRLEAVTVEDLCLRAGPSGADGTPDFTI